MSTSNKNSYTNVSFSEETLIGASTLAILFATLPLINYAGIQVGLFILSGTLVSLIATYISKQFGYTKRAQVRVLFGGVILTILSSSIVLVTSLLTGAILFTITSICSLLQLRIML